MPPSALLRARSAWPFQAAVTDSTLPDSEVVAPNNTAPASASPARVRSASSSTTAVILTPAVAITATQTANASRLRGRDACRMSMAGSRSAR